MTSNYCTGVCHKLLIFRELYLQGEGLFHCRPVQGKYVLEIPKSLTILVLTSVMHRESIQLSRRLRRTAVVAMAIVLGDYF